MSDLTIPLKVVDNGDGTYSITSVINAALPTGDNTIGKVGIAGSLVKNETDKAVTADTDLITDYTAAANCKSLLMVMTNTSGILSLEVDAKLGSLNSGTALDVNKWYAFEIPLLSGSVYNLRFSANATMQIKWIGDV